VNVVLANERVMLVRYVQCNLKCANEMKNTRRRLFVPAMLVNEIIP